MNRVIIASEAREQAKLLVPNGASLAEKCPSNHKIIGEELRLRPVVHLLPTLVARTINAIIALGTEFGTGRCEGREDTAVCRR